MEKRVVKFYNCVWDINKLIRVWKYLFRKIDCLDFYFPIFNCKNVEYNKDR